MWVRIVGGDVDFILNDTVDALEIARGAGDDASQARCLYGLAVAGTGESELFEAVFELGAAAGDVRFRNYGGAAGALSVVGTDRADRYFQQAASLGAGFDDETFRFVLPGMSAHHCSLRGDQARAATLFRQALEHESRAIAAVFNVVGAAMFAALQSGDTELLRTAPAYIGAELRELPGCEWWVELLDDAAAVAEPDAAASSLPVPMPMFLVLLQSGLIVRLLLSAGRFDDVERWALQVPETWPAAHADASLARCWVAAEAADERAPELIHSAVREIARLGLRPLLTEAVELLAVEWSLSGRCRDASRLLGAAAGARDEIGLQWRFPHHQRIVDDALQRVRSALGNDAFEAAYNDVATADLDDIVVWLQRE